VDEANLPGSPQDGPIAAEAINHVLSGVRGEKCRFSALAEDGFDSGLAACGIAAENGHFGAGLGQALRQCTTQHASGANDNRCFT